jgi:hypothetical protein
VNKTLLRATGLAFALALATTPTPARAQPSAGDKAAADLLFTDAEKLVEAGQFAVACPKLAESQRLDPQLGTLLHLADCYEKNRQTASAWASFREATELAAKKGDPREQVAKDRAAALEPKLARVTIVVPPGSDVAGLEVQRDGQSVARVLWGSAVPVDPGKHAVVARAEGRESFSKDLDVSDAGQTVSVSIPILAPNTTASPSPSPPGASHDAAPGGPPQSGGSALKTVGWIVAGVGVAGLVTGGIFAAITASKGNDADAICPSGKGCSPDEISRYDATYSDAQSAATVSRVAFVAGGVLIAGGIAMVLLAPSSRAGGASSTMRVGAAPGKAAAPWGISW